MKIAKNVYASEAYDVTTLEDQATIVRSDIDKDITLQIRMETDKAKQNLLKATLNSLVLANFEGARKYENFSDCNYVVLDLDEYDSNRHNELKERMKQLKGCIWVQESPRQKLKAIIKLARKVSNPSAYSETAKFVIEFFNKQLDVKFDPRASNPVGYMYRSWDANLYTNFDATPFEVPSNIISDKVRESEKLLEYQNKEVEDLINVYGAKRIATVIKTHIDKISDIDYDTWSNMLFGLIPLGYDEGFLIIKAHNDIALHHEYNFSRIETQWRAHIDSDKRNNRETMFTLISLLNYFKFNANIDLLKIIKADIISTSPFEPFWDGIRVYPDGTYNKNYGKVNNNTNFELMLHTIGLRKYNGRFVYVDSNNIMTEDNSTDLATNAKLAEDYVLKELKKYITSDLLYKILYENLIKPSSVLRQRASFSNSTSILDDFFTSNLRHIIFKNGILFITHENFYFTPLGQQKGVINSKDIKPIALDINLIKSWYENAVDYNNGVISTFMQRAYGGAYDAMKSWLAFFMSSKHLKEQSTNRALIMVDPPMPGGNPEGRFGGTGKGLFQQIMQQCTSTSFIDGKRAYLDQKFFFQNARRESNLLIIDEFNANQNLDIIFPVVAATSFEVRLLGVGAVDIPFKDAWHCLIATNGVPFIMESSHKRRFDMIMTSDYYRNIIMAGNTVRDDLDIEYDLFDKNMPLEEWQKFYYFVIGCVMEFPNRIQVKDVSGILSRQQQFTEQEEVVFSKFVKALISFPMHHYFVVNGEDNNTKITCHKHNTGGNMYDEAKNLISNVSNIIPFHSGLLLNAYVESFGGSKNYIIMQKFVGFLHSNNMQIVYENNVKVDINSSRMQGNFIIECQAGNEENDVF